MVDVVTSRTLKDTTQYSKIHLTNISDGTGEAAVNKVDVSTLANAANNDTNRVAIKEIEWKIKDGAVHLLWDGDTNTTATILTGNGKSSLTIPNDNPNGAITGDILLSTIGFAGNSTYDIAITVAKTSGFANIDGYA